EPLEGRRLYAADPGLQKLALVHQELPRPPTALVTWGTGAGFRVATPEHATAADGHPVLPLNFHDGVPATGHTGGTVKLRGPTAIAVADLDGDSFGDLVSWAGDHCDITMMSERGPRQTISLDGTFSSSKDTGRISGVADLDGDGRAELVGFNDSARVVLFGGL